MSKVMTLPQMAKNGLADWLNVQDWDLWTTLSTSYELTLPGARRAVTRFHDKRSKFSPCRVFFATEKFDVKDGFHLHSLWKFEGNIFKKENYKDFVADWRTVCRTDKANVYSEKYYKEFGAHKYISKYITKEITDYDFFDTNSQFKEKIGNDIHRMDKIIRSMTAKKKIEKLCKKYEVNYDDVRKEWKEECMENAIWYNDIDKEKTRIYGY
jgi:hypothetical protein